MATATIALASSSATLDVIEADLILDIHGAWGAHLEVSGDVELSGAVTLTIAGENGAAASAFVGTIRRSLKWRGRTRAVIAGGAGGLLAALEPRDYLAGVQAVRPGLIASHIAAAAGETLAAGVEDDLDEFGFERWTRTSGSGVEALDVLAQQLGMGWRVLADGTIWIGAETWPASSASLGDVWIDDGDDGRIDCAPPVASLRPGEIVTTDAARRIDRVTYRVRSAEVRAELLYSVNGDAEERAAPLIFREVHAGTVVVQTSSGALDLKMDDERLPGLRGVKFKPGIVGCYNSIAPGDRVRVAFADGDPSQPFAFALEPETSGNTHGVVRVGHAGDGGTVTATAGGDPVVFTYIDPFGNPTGGITLTIVTKATQGSSEVKIR